MPPQSVPGRGRAARRRMPRFRRRRGGVRLDPREAREERTEGGGDHEYHWHRHTEQPEGGGAYAHDDHGTDDAAQAANLVAPDHLHHDSEGQPPSGGDDAREHRLREVVLLHLRDHRREHTRHRHSGGKQREHRDEAATHPRDHCSHEDALRHDVRAGDEFREGIRLVVLRARQPAARLHELAPHEKERRRAAPKRECPDAQPREKEIAQWRRRARRGVCGLLRQGQRGIGNERYGRFGFGGRAVPHRFLLRGAVGFRAAIVPYFAPRTYHGRNSGAYTAVSVR